MHKGGLRLDLSLSRDAFESSMNATYRKEGLSVGADHMRLYGEAYKMEVAFSDLEMGDRIGQGACSSVNLARHKKTGVIYAIKLFNVCDQAQESQLFNEIFLLTSFQCDALIALKGAFHDQGCIGVILEYMDKGSLEFILQRGVTMSESVMAAISFQIIWGLGYLHYEKQIHRDIKPANILMNSKGQVKLSDFGISKELDNSTAMSHTAVGSYRYMSPERLLGDKYDASGDIWSVGITIVQLWDKHYPFSDVADTPIDLLSELERIDLEHVLPRNRFPQLMRRFIRSMLAFKPDDRATCSELAGSEWFASCGVHSLDDAHLIVARWLKDLERVHHSAHTAIQRPSGKPPKKDANQMSISLEASKSWAKGGASTSSQRGASTSLSAMSIDEDYRPHNKGIASSRSSGVARGSLREGAHEDDEEEYSQDEFEDDHHYQSQHSDSRGKSHNYDSYDYKEEGKHSGGSRPYRK